MKAEELRIGNWVNAEVNLPSLMMHEILPIDILDIFNGKVKCYGIPLTEEILLKCGFVWQDDYLVLEKNKICIRTHLPNFKPNKVFVYLHGISILELNSLHELQNLIFALTGKELIFNNK